MTRKELEADAVLVKSLARICGRDGAEALTEGLARAAARGTLLRASVSGRGSVEDIYLLNTPRNRKALETMPGAGWVFDQPLPPGDASITPNIFSLYEQNIGSITPLIADDLKEAEERYPPTWLHDAFREAVELNKRSWRYIERILRRWEAEGRDNEEPERDPQRQWLADRYREGKRQPNARSLKPHSKKRPRSAPAATAPASCASPCVSAIPTSARRSPANAP